MHGPPLVAWLLVVLSAAAAAVCLVRREAGEEALNGAGMAVMAVPVTVADPWPWAAPLFAVVYAPAALRALLPSRHRAGHRLHHAVCSATMVYMALAMARTSRMPPMAHMRSVTGGHAVHTTAGVPLLTGLLLLYFAGYALRTGTFLVAAPPRPPLISGLLEPVPGFASSARGAGAAASGAVRREAVRRPHGGPVRPVPATRRGASRRGAVPGGAAQSADLEQNPVAPATPLSRPGAGGHIAGAAGARRYAPEVAAACRVSMALGMVAMLLAL